MKPFLVSLLLVAGLTCASMADDRLVLGAANIHQPSEHLTTAGQPSANDLERLKAAGYTTVINLQGLGENALDEAALATTLGIRYIALPIADANDLTVENAFRLDAALKLADGPTFMHCASGNRVGALMALRAYHVLNMSPADAMAVGKAAGMTKLTPVVSDLIDSAAKAHP